MGGGIRRDPEGALRRAQVILQLGGGGGDPVFTHLPDIGGGNIADGAGGIKHHAGHEEEGQDNREETAEEAPRRNFPVPRSGGGFPLFIHRRRGRVFRRALGAPAHMRFLLRTRSGAFSIEDAVTVEECSAEIARALGR